MRLNVNVDLSVDISLTKECTECHEVKPLDAFYKHPTGKFGRQPKCKVCLKALDANRRKEYKALNETLSFEELTARTPLIKCSTCKDTLPSVEFYRNDNNKSGLGTQCRGCISIARAETREIYTTANELLSMVEIRSRTPERWCCSCKQTVSSSLFNRTNAQPTGLSSTCSPCSSSYSSQYKKDNRDKFRGYNAKRRALQLGLFIEDISYKELVARDGEECGYCHVTGVALEIEHIWPLNMEGYHVPDNLTLACKSCNSSKKATRPEVYITREGFTPNETIVKALARENELTRQ